VEIPTLDKNFIYVLKDETKYQRRNQPLQQVNSSKFKGQDSIYNSKGSSKGRNSFILRKYKFCDIHKVHGYSTEECWDHKKK